MIGKTMVTDHASTIKAIDATTPAETLTLTMASPTFKVRMIVYVDAGLSAYAYVHAPRTQHSTQTMCDTTRCTPFSITIQLYQVRVDKSKGDIGLSLTNNPSGVGVTVCADS